MTMQSIGLNMWPTPILAGNQISSALTDFGIVFDSTTDRLAWIGHAYQTDSIASLYLRTRTITLGDTLEFRIETVVNGRPSGTLWSANGTGANPKGTVAIADTDDSIWKTVTLTNAANLVPGDLFAIVIVWSAESAGAGINMQFSQNNSGVIGIGAPFVPQWIQDTGAGTWTALSTLTSLNFVVVMTSAGPTTFPGMMPISGSGTITAFNNTTNPNERGVKFVAPFKCRVVGMQAAMFNLAAGANFTFSIWDSTDNPGAGPTPLAQTASMDGDVAIATTSDGNVTMMFTAPVTLTAGTTYYAGVRPDTANDIGFGELSAAGTGAATNAIRAFGIGANTFHLSTRQWVGTDPGAWTDTTTTFPMISFLIDQLDDGTGGGAASVQYRSNMSGGL